MIKPVRQTKGLARAAMIAAVYCLLTVLLQPLSFGAVQFRLAEALMLLPVLCPEAVPGLFAGCFLANLLGGGMWLDVLAGSLATLLSAFAVRKCSGRPLLGAGLTVLINAALVGPVVWYAYLNAPGAAALFSTVLTVGLGEAAAVFVPGLLLLRFLRKLPVFKTE